MIYYLFKLSLKTYLIELKKFINSIPIIFSLILFVALISPLIIVIINYQYFDNPFFRLSPPGFLKVFFPDAISNLNYQEVKESLALRNINSLIKRLHQYSR